jgi:hypothetical protein
MARDRFKTVQNGYMCIKHARGVNYYDGGTLVQTTRNNIDKTARTAREMAEVQRDAYGALAENLAAAQRRTMGLAEGGLEFMRLQEQGARAAQRWLADSVRLLQLQQRNAEFVQGWAGNAVEAAREQTEHNVRTAEAFARSVRKQQESFRSLGWAWAETYRNFFTPFAYAQEGMRMFQRATQRGLEATEQASREGLRVSERATEQTEEVLRQVEETVHEAELRTIVYGSLRTTDYDELSVEEVAKRLEGLSTAELRQVREFEKKNKNRETLIERIDSKIRANS